MTFGIREKEMRQWLEEQGVVFGNNWWTYPHIKACFGECAAVFPDLFDHISLLYVYNQSQQQYEGGTTDDAVFWYYTTPDNAVLYAIGVSTAAAAEGEKYLLLCILHELAHMKNLIESGNSNHRIFFHTVLDNLIRKFNEATGRNIENDFNGLEMRHDSKTWILPDSIPTQIRKQGQEFRNG